MPDIIAISESKINENTSANLNIPGYLLNILNIKSKTHEAVLFCMYPMTWNLQEEVHKYNARYASKQNLYIKQVRTNTGKQTIGYAACIIWERISLKLKELNIHQFSKQLKPYLLSEQHS